VTRLRRTAAVAGLGLAGVGGLGATLALSPGALPTVPGVPPAAVVALSLVQPALLVLVAAALGAVLAPAVGLRSRVAARAAGDRVAGSFRAEARLAVPAGLATGVVLVGLDLAYWTVVGGPDPTPTAAGAVLAGVPLRLLYGGLTEEVLLRWGLVTLLVWAGWRLTGRPETPSPAVAWTAVVVAAVAFGVGHLPAVAATTPLGPALVARTVALNAVAGVVYGWLYWRRSLEAAMVAHAATHLPLVAAALLT
jgi:hypothetical protein